MEKNKAEHIRTVKFRIYPNKTQEKLLISELEKAREIFNIMLEQRLRVMGDVRDSRLTAHNERDRHELRYPGIWESVPRLVGVYEPGRDIPEKCNKSGRIAILTFIFLMCVHYKISSSLL